MKQNIIKNTALLFVVTSLFAIGEVKSQTTEFIYFDSNWDETSYSNRCYKRMINYNYKGEFIEPITDFHPNGKVQSLLYPDGSYNVHCAKFPTECNSESGKIYFFDEYGNSTSDCFYSNYKLRYKVEYDVYENVISRSGCESGNCYFGFGTWWYESGDVYVGNFYNGLKHGHGAYILTTGETIKGEFRNDSFLRSSELSNWTLNDLNEILGATKSVIEIYQLLNKE